MMIWNQRSWSPLRAVAKPAKTLIHIVWAWNYYTLECCSMPCFQAQAVDLLIIYVAFKAHMAIIYFTILTKLTFFVSYMCDLQPNTLFTLQLSVRADLVSAVSANTVLLKQSHMWNQQRLKHKRELQSMKAGK